MARSAPLRWAVRAGGAAGPVAPGVVVPVARRVLRELVGHLVVDASDARLGAAGIERRIALVTPHFTATIAAVAASDLVTTISAAFASRFAGAFGLVLKPPPFDDALDLTVVSTRVRAADPARDPSRAPEALVARRRAQELLERKARLF